MRWLRALVVWLVVMAAESVHGALRTILIAPPLGDFRARRVTVFTGSLVTVRAMVAVGPGWVMVTVGFEVLLGRLAAACAPSISLIARRAPNENEP